MCKHVSICMFVFFTFSKTFYAAYLVCLLQLKPWHLQLSSHLLILTSTHNEHIHMIPGNILMTIFMQVFGVCKSYNYITHLSTYIPTRSRANHLLVYLFIPQPHKLMGSSVQKSSRVHWCRCRVRFNEVPEKVPKVPEKVWEALVQSQVTFNRVPEKVPEKVGEALVLLLLLSLLLATIKLFLFQFQLCYCHRPFWPQLFKPKILKPYIPLTL